jgi:hypothetical protein
VIGERWGVTDEEVAAHYPCDDVVASPAVQVWRGITVDATPAQIWPWLCQLRLAPYSYDWLDNLGYRSPRELRGLPDPQPGEAFSRVAGGRIAVGRVLSVSHEEHLTAQIMGAVLSYVLRPEAGGTRLLMKVVLERRWYAVPVAVGDWPMARRQLLNLKSLAEATAVRPG